MFYQPPIHVAQSELSGAKILLEICSSRHWHHNIRRAARHYAQPSSNLSQLIVFLAKIFLCPTPRGRHHACNHGTYKRECVCEANDILIQRTDTANEAEQLELSLTKSPTPLLTPHINGFLLRPRRHLHQLGARFCTRVFHPRRCRWRRKWWLCRRLKRVTNNPLGLGAL